MNLLRLILILFCLCWLCFTANAQTVDEPKVCIPQEVANRCAELARLDKAKDEKIAALEESVKARDKAIEDLKALNAANVADLTKALHETELKLAIKTGEAIGLDKQVVECRALVTALVPMLRPKKNGLINF